MIYYFTFTRGQKDVVPTFQNLKKACLADYWSAGKKGYIDKLKLKKIFQFPQV